MAKSNNLVILCGIIMEYVDGTMLEGFARTLNRPAINSIGSIALDI